MHESCDPIKFKPYASHSKMSVLSFAQVLRSYFLFSTVGFTFICDEGEQMLSLSCSVLDEVLCVGHEY